MTQEEGKRWNTLIDIIQADIAYYGILEMEAKCDEDIFAYGSVLLALQKVLSDIQESVYCMMVDQFQKDAQKEIAVQLDQEGAQ